MSTIFSGLRVVDLTQGMLTMASTMLADFGADVIKVEPPSGDRGRGHDGFHIWNRGKRSLVVDLDTAEGRERLKELVDTADVVIDVMTEMRPLSRLDPDAARARNGGLVYCLVTGFGEASDLEPFGTNEQMVTARTGRLMGNDSMSGVSSTRDDLDRPLYIASPASTYGAAMLAVQAIVSALLQRARTGVGRAVSTSLLDGISAATMRLAFERRGDEVVPVAKRHDGDIPLLMRGIRLCFLTVETKDARFIQMCCRQPRLYRNWMRAIGLGDELSTERWGELPLGVRSVEDAFEWEDRVRERMRTRTREEWMTIFRVEDIGADPFLTEEEFLRHAQLVENDRLVRITDPDVGEILQLGPIMTATGTPAEIRLPAPALDSAAGEPMWTTDARPAAERAQVSDDLPLSGYTILEVASFLAAPLGPTLLAELGARVIKVEPLEGDPFRSSGLEFVHIGNGKESIALNLKRPEGRAILHKLIAESDALIHNFRPGVPEKLGFGYEEARSIRPDLVYLYGASYGSKGPESHRAAFHSTPNALTGGGILQAGVNNPPVNDSYSDPCSGIATGVALVMGLYAREQHGLGQYLETSMLVSAGWVHSARMESYDGRGPRPQMTQEQTGFSAFDRLYKSAEGWIMLAADSTDESWCRLTALVGDQDWQTDARYADLASRVHNDRTLQRLLEDVFVTRTAAEWERAGRDVGLPIASAADHTFEEFLVKAGLVESEEHPAFGTYWRLRSRVRVVGSKPRRGLPCALGEHTESVLRAIGMSGSEIAQLEQDGVVVSAPPESRHPRGLAAADLSAPSYAG